jgi:hypothetical protein
MIGLDALGVMLIALALSLMTVDPIHITIARAKPKSTTVSAIVEDQASDAPAFGPDEVARLADELLEGDPLYGAIESIARIYNQA